MNTFVKIIAAVIRKRLQEVSGRTLSPTQFAFRPKLNTSYALHIVRRIICRNERSGQEGHFVFLDWAKAFDKIINEKLFRSLRKKESMDTSSVSVR